MQGKRAAPAAAACMCVRAPWATCCNRALHAALAEHAALPRVQRVAACAARACPASGVPARRPPAGAPHVTARGAGALAPPACAALQPVRTPRRAAHGAVRGRRCGPGGAGAAIQSRSQAGRLVRARGAALHPVYARNRATHGSVRGRQCGRGAHEQEPGRQARAGAAQAHAEVSQAGSSKRAALWSRS